MIWPFKKREPELTREEYAATQPPAPCGAQQMHWLWKLDGMPCPACAAIRIVRRKDAELDALADKIVERIRRAQRDQASAEHDSPSSEARSIDQRE